MSFCFLIILPSPLQPVNTIATDKLAPKVLNNFEFIIDRGFSLNTLSKNRKYLIKAKLIM